MSVAFGALTLVMALLGHTPCFAQSAIPTDGFRPQSYIKGYRVAFQPSTDLKKYIRRYATLRRDPSELMS